VHDLGFADAVIPAVTGRAVIIVETAVIGPGLVTESMAPITGSPTASTSGSSANSGSTQSQPPLRDFAVRRFDAAGRALGTATGLPAGMRVATDSAVGLVVWQPANRVYDSGLPLEALSADAMLIRPDHSLRRIGAYHPLSATGTSLLIWDVKSRRFGLVPLLKITETKRITTATPAGTTGSKSPEPTKSPPPLEGVKWFAPTRGFLVTGPASFSPDSASFAVYAQVGGRRRLIVAQLRYLGTDQVDVLALAQTEPSPTALETRSPAARSSARGTNPDGTSSSSGTAAVAFDREAFPITAPLAPSWWKDTLLAVAADGNLIGYQPGNKQASLLDLGLGDLESLALFP
jgi:hypothetical protein